MHSTGVGPIRSTFGSNVTQVTDLTRSSAPPVGSYPYSTKSTVDPFSVSALRLFVEFKYLRDLRDSGHLLLPDLVLVPPIQRKCLALLMICTTDQYKM